MRKKALTSALIIALLAALPLATQSENGFGFDMNLGIGVNSFVDPSTGEPSTWQNLRLQPDISIGKFGIGLDISLNFRFADENGDSGFQIREEDWVPNKELGTTFADLYLPLFRYLRYGQKGEPLFAKIGSIDDAILGNGFIIGNYANTNFLPLRRVTGLSFDFDGNLLNFPYLGIETFISNLSAFNVLGARLFTRPLAWTGVPIIQTAQLGFTVAADLNPFYYEAQEFKALYAQDNSATNKYASFWDKDSSLDSDASNDNLDKEVLIYGVDLRVPILSTDVVSLAAFTDLVFQNKTQGFMIGLGGQLLKLFNYGAQIRIMGEDFIPVYFDRTYDLYRTAKWEAYQGHLDIPAYQGWFASLGLNALEGLVNFNIGMEGSFANENSLDILKPTLRGHLSVAPELLAGFSIQGSYEKRYISSLGDLVSAENAVIGLILGYKTGPASINLIYDVKYNPNSTTGESWETSSRIETTISF